MSTNKEVSDLIIKVATDNGELSCRIVNTFPLDNSFYISLNPISSDEVMLFRYKKHDDGIQLFNIENEFEFQQVSNKFNTIVNEKS